MEERPVPNWPHWYARSDGSVRTPDNRILWGTPIKSGHRCFFAKNSACRYQTCWVHRFVAMAFVVNPCPALFVEVDHIDRCPSNNKPENLRWLSRSLNSLNKKSKNAVWNKRRKRFACIVTINRVRHHLGYFFTEEECSEVAFDYKLRMLDTIYHQVVNAQNKTEDR